MKTRLFFLLTVICGIVSLSSFAQDSPHEIRIIYFLPHNRQPHPNIDTKIDMLIKEVQQFYADQMNANGFGRKTFKLETDDSGRAQVHHVDGQFTAEYYNSEPGALGRILSELDERFDMSQRIFFIVADVTYPGSHWRGGGQAQLGGHSIVFIPFDGRFVSRYFAAHEIGHSFGLKHDYRYAAGHATDIMSYWVGIDFEDRTLSKCAAEWLDVSPYFNPDQTSNNEPTTIQMLTPLAYPPNAISLRFEVTDPNGIHQAQLIIPRDYGFSLHGCKSLNGEKDSTIEFITTELTTSRNKVTLGIVDVHGNFRWEPYFIAVVAIQPADVINVNNPAPEWLQKVSGDNQIGYLNNRLIDPFVVIVRDIDDEPVAGVQVMFQVIAGEGELSVTNPWTDSDGLVQTYLTLGSSQTDPVVSVSVSGVSEPITFTATVSQPPAEIVSPLATLTGHTEGVRDVAYSFDGSTLASADYDGTAHLWDATAGRHKATFGSYTTSIAFSPDELTLASGRADFDRRKNTIDLWDIVTGRRKRTFDVSDISTSAGVLVTYSPDGSTLAGGSAGEIHLLDASTGQHKNTFIGHGDYSVRSITFSPDRRTLASSGGDGTIRLWDTVTGQQLKTLIEEPSRSCAGGLAFNDDGSILASVWCERIILWDPVTGEQLRTFTEPTSWFSAVAFSPDGDILATGNGSGEIRLWDPVTGALEKILIGHESYIISITFSPDGSMLASGSDDKTVRLWELTPMTAPLIFTPSTFADQTFTVGTAVSLTLPVATGGTPPYTYTLAPLPGGLSFNATERLLSGTPITAGTTTATYTATDAANVSASLPFTIEVTDGVILDVNGDGIVNIQDLVLVSSSFGQTGESHADVNGDGVVNIQDLVLVASAFGEGTAAAPALHPSVLAKLSGQDIQRWLDDAKHLGRTDAAQLRGIAVLEQLLALLLPKETALSANYPNPFNPETWIPYHLALAADVEVTIYDTKGAVVRQLDIGHQSAGYYINRTKAAYWDGRNESGESVASGIYFYQLRAGDYSATKRMVIVK
jgi:WD40 repeat protein